MLGNCFKTKFSVNSRCRRKVPIILLILSIGFTFFASLSFADYSDLKEEFNDYTPPDYFRSQMIHAPESSKPPDENDAAFKAEKEQIANIKASWEELLSVDKDEDSFIQIDSKHIEKYQSIADDDLLTANIFKKKFSLTDLETFVLLRHPNIKAEEKRMRAAIESFRQISNLDEILRQYTAFTEGLMTGVGPMKEKDSVKMKFPFPGTLALKGEIVNQEVKAAKENLEIARRDAVTEARKTYWNLIFIRKSRAITSETVTLLKQLEAVAKTRYKTGNTSFQDVIKVNIQREILSEELRNILEKQRNIEAKIRELLNLPSDVKIGIPKSVRISGKVASLESLYTQALEKKQELRRMKAMIAKMERMVEMAETMILPPYTLNLSIYEDEAVMNTGSARMKEPFSISTEASMGAGLPKMPWYGTNDAYLSETRQKVEALKKDLKKAENSTITMVRNAWAELDKANRETFLYRKKVVDLSKSALDVSTRGYESGTVSFADVIGSYTTWLNVRLALAQKQSNIGVAKAELERVVGVSFE